MLQALLRTTTEIFDSKKAAYSFLAAVFASVLHLYFGLTVENALLLASPLVLATAAQAHVDAATAKAGNGAEPAPAAAAPAAPAVAETPATPASGT